MLLEGYINVKKHGDRTFHITCIGECSTSQSTTSRDLGSEAASLSTYMFQTKQPQVCRDWFWTLLLNYILFNTISNSHIFEILNTFYRRLTNYSKSSATLSLKIGRHQRQYLNWEMYSCSSNFLSCKLPDIKWMGRILAFIKSSSPDESSCHAFHATS